MYPHRFSCIIHKHIRLLRNKSHHPSKRLVLCCVRLRSIYSTTSQTCRSLNRTNYTLSASFTHSARHLTTYSSNSLSCILPYQQHCTLKVKLFYSYFNCWHIYLSYCCNKWRWTFSHNMTGWYLNKHIFNIVPASDLNPSFKSMTRFNYLIFTIDSQLWYVTSSFTK